MYKNKFIMGLFAIGLLVLVGCKKDNESIKAVFVSTSDVVTLAMESPSNTISATAEGDADLVGDEAITERGFCWAPNPKPTIADNKITNGTGTGNFKANITGLTFAGDFYIRAYAISNGQTYYGNEVKFLASVPVEIIINGDLSLPASPLAITINETTNWKTDEVNGNLIGRAEDSWNGGACFWMQDYAKSFYQLAGIVPSRETDYTIKFDANWTWTDWNDYDPIISVIFSAYSGNDASTRVVIGKTDFTNGFFPGWGNNWVTQTGTFSIPAGSEYAGKNLVIEFDVLPYDGPWDPNLWFEFDNISVIQKLK